MSTTGGRSAAIFDSVSAPIGLFRTGVIGQARQRQRRRRRRLAAAAILTAAIVVAANLAATGARRPGGPTVTSTLGRVAAFVPATRVLSQTPYLGVNCPVANSIACDRVGLAVNLRRPAVAVTATVAGWILPLTKRGDLPAVRGRPRTEFDGFLHPAGIAHHLHVIPDGGPSSPNSWYGNTPQPQIDIRLLINYGQGNLVTTQTTVDLSTGWG